MNQVDAAGVAMDALPPADHPYFEILGEEPADRKDLTMRGLAASLGIMPGQRFTPGRPPARSASRLAPPSLAPARRCVRCPRRPPRNRWLHGDKRADQMPAPDGQQPAEVRRPAWLLWLGVVMGSNARYASVPGSRAWGSARRAAAHRNPGRERSRLPSWGHAT